MMWLHHRAWAWSCGLEKVRKRTHAQRHLCTKAAACIGLAILRRWGC